MSANQPDEPASPTTTSAGNEAGPAARDDSGLGELAIWQLLRARLSRLVFCGTWFLCTGLFLGLFAGAYLTLGSHLVHGTNSSDEDLRGGDQRHNIKLAVVSRQIREGEGEFAGRSRLKSGLLKKTPHYTDGVVAPLWPWVGSFLLPDDEEIQVGGPAISPGERAQFERGKRFLILLGCSFLVLSGVVMLRFFSQPAVFVILLAGGLGALLPRGAFYQPEVLSYILLCASWVTVLFLLGRNTLPRYLLLGIFLGLAYLAKTSIQPLVGGFLIATTLRWGLIIRSRRRGEPAGDGWDPKTHKIGLAVLLLAFCLVTGPRLIHSNRQFGSMTHTYPSYWMWMDRFEDCYLWMQLHGSAEALEMTGKDAPSFLNYLGNHTTNEFLRRLFGGTSYVVGRFFDPPKTRRDKSPPRPWKRLLEHRGGYLGLLSLVALGMLAQHALLARDRPRLPGDRGITSAVFVLGTFLLAALAYGWYSPIGKGDRFMLSLYLPLVVTLVWLSEHLHRRIPRDRPAGKLASGCYLASMALLCGTLVWRTIELLDRPEFA